MQPLPWIIALRISCQANSRRCFSVRRSWYYIMLFVAWFVCLCLFICVAIAYISRSFVLSNQIEFAVLLNRSFVISNTTHKLYVIRFMCRLYVIRSIQRLYVIRFIYKMYVIRSMYRICGIRFVHKLSVSWSII